MLGATLLAVPSEAKHVLLARVVQNQLDLVADESASTPVCPHSRVIPNAHEMATWPNAYLSGPMARLARELDRRLQEDCASSRRDR